MSGCSGTRARLLYSTSESIGMACSFLHGGPIISLRRRGVKRRLCVPFKPRYLRSMKVNGKPSRTIWLEPDGWSVGIIDQTQLPHRVVLARLTSLSDAV